MTCLPESTTTPAQVPSSPSRFRKHRAKLTGLLLVLVAWIFYLPSISYDFVSFDDVRILKDHPDLYGQPNLSADLHAIFVTSFPREEPLLLRDVSWAIDSQLFGFGNPFGYHLVNVLLHGATVGLLFILLLQMTQRYTFALATAGAWLLLAVHTEPVAWIMGRKDILSTLFMLMALCAQTHRLRSQTTGSKAFWHVLTIISVLSGLLSKISAITFPGVLLLQATLFSYLNASSRQSKPQFSVATLIREGLWNLPNFLLCILAYAWYSRILTQMGIFDRGYTARGLQHLVNLLVIDPFVFWIYLKQLFLPSGLTVIYSWPALQASYSPWQVVGAVATLGLATGFGIALFRKRKDLFFYYTAFFTLMVPYMNLAYIGIWIAERYVYFAAVFPLAIFVSLAEEALKRPSASIRISMLGIAALFAIDNVFQKLSYEPAWSNAETLWQYHVDSAKPTPEAFCNLATYYYSLASSHQNTPTADVAVQKMAMVIEAGLRQFWTDPTQAPPVRVWNLVFLKSILQEATGHPQEALASLLLADELRPGFDAINLNLARLYFRLAKTSSDFAQAQTYRRNAQQRFAHYVQVAFRGRTPPPEIQQEMQSINAAS